jgi:hypothetical protein
MNWTLKGWKSYLCGGALVLVSGLHAMGYINDATFDTLKNALLGGGVMALAARVKTLVKG